MTKIREASIEDTEGISLVSSSLGYPPSSIEESGKRLEDILASKSDFVWVYEGNGKIMGWLHLFLAIRLASTKFAEIGGLVVDESCRRSGIGGELVGEAIQWSRQNNFPLRVRCNFNREEANKFYRSLGFESKKTQKVHELSFS